MGSSQLNVVAMRSRAEVFRDVGDNRNAMNTYNGVNWCFSENRSWGFAPGSEDVARLSCYTNTPKSKDQL